MLFSNPKKSHLDILRNKFNTKSNTKSGLGDFKIKNNFSQYKILSNNNNSRINSPKKKDDVKNNYDKYKYNPNLNRNRVYSSKKTNRNDLYNFRGLSNNKNHSFCSNDSSRNNSFDSGGGWDGNLLKNQMPQVKRSELNTAINERNINRKKFIDKINSPNKNFY
jgi:hypothetical protein